MPGEARKDNLFPYKLFSQIMLLILQYKLKFYTPASYKRPYQYFPQESGDTQFIMQISNAFWPIQRLMILPILSHLTSSHLNKAVIAPALFPCSAVSKSRKMEMRAASGRINAHAHATFDKFRSVC